MNISFGWQTRPTRSGPTSLLHRPPEVPVCVDDQQGIGSPVSGHLPAEAYPAPTKGYNGLPIRRESAPLDLELVGQLDDDTTSRNIPDAGLPPVRPENDHPRSVRGETDASRHFKAERVLRFPSCSEPKLGDEANANLSACRIENRNFLGL
ncbi:MAG TPA: hypothetical protein VGI99_13785 [Gemmataceae bacterium]|jgi:hypothetical protein